ncbi:conserved hypothetical protein [Theileria orientalis strain Shintoku]|uniref:Uncharacterized protein n=1 Tax=Theileria orientalis strain Shintoku TaxID=869250 RepID=J4D9N2_THEOR|nr:conserved hypothetical protein [Theileria orientalis strain Shintoku]PVC53803.1 hypothetical protein MACL_00003459 [Theileria orientalis]BAM41495.1 conserved hypothetical protein [Theileria orientalis strain Shintoku]|eukprot:XP_009691796.1 conserved hypothetical protein [Theileria orientalis strain Shintoku]
MAGINSSAEVELLSSMELMEDSVDMSVVKNELKRIKDSKKLSDRNVLNVLEDCITDSAVSINELNEYSNNSSRTSIKNSNSDINRLLKDSGDNVANIRDSVAGKGRIVEAEDPKMLTIMVNDDLNISFNDGKLNIIIRSHSDANSIIPRVALFLMLLLLLVR